jgi:hypothetical protein
VVGKRPAEEWKRGGSHKGDAGEGALGRQKRILLAGIGVTASGAHRVLSVPRTACLSFDQSLGAISKTRTDLL